MNQSINTDSKNSKEPQQKYCLGTVSIKILGGLKPVLQAPNLCVFCAKFVFKFVFSVLSKTVSSGVVNIETDDQRYSQTVQPKRPHNVTGLDCKM